MYKNLKILVMLALAIFVGGGGIFNIHPVKLQRKLLL